VEATFNGVKMGTMMSQARRFPPFQKLITMLIPPSVKQKRRENSDYSVEKVTRRIERGANASPNFMSYILRHNDEKGMSRPEIDGTAAVLFVAGSETTAILLSGLCYHLLKNPAAMARLNGEIRGAFETEEEITISAVEHLPYLMAVFQESLRIYPPAPAAFERVVPGEGDEICGQWIPGGVSLPILTFVSSRKLTIYLDQSRCLQLGHQP
jgi:cytochrome P450